MNLEKCPRCGARWTGGGHCISCGYVPIGANIKAQNKKSRPKRRWADPTGTPFWIWIVLLGGAAWGASKLGLVDKAVGAVGEMRAEMDRKPPVQGTYRIVSSAPAKKGATPILFDKKIQAGSVALDKEGHMKFRLNGETSQNVMLSKYEWNGKQFLLRDIRLGSADSPAPASADMRMLTVELHQKDENTIVLIIGGKERLLLQKVSDKPDLTSREFNEVLGHKVDAPAELKGVMNRLKAQMEEEES